MAQSGAEFIVGLDPGQAAETTGLAVVEREPMTGDAGPIRDDRGRPQYRYDGVYLRRFPSKTLFPEIVAAVAELVRKPELGSERANGWRPRLAIDATGVGKPVVDLFLARSLGAEAIPVTITMGEASRWDRWPESSDRAAWVSKVELAGTIQALSQTGRLRFAPGLPLAAAMQQELRDFRVKVALGPAPISTPWREGAHADLILSVAVAVWVGENAPAPAGSPRVGFTQERPGPTVFVPGGGPPTVGRAGPRVYIPGSGGLA
jgi:hypothetical protein